MGKNRKHKFNGAIKTFVRDNLSKFRHAIREAGKEGEASDPPAAGAVRLERAVAIVNDLVDIPILPEAAEELLFKAVITAIVEFAKSVWGKSTWLANI